MLQLYTSLMGFKLFLMFTIFIFSYSIFLIYWLIFLRKKEQRKKSATLKSVGVLISGGILSLLFASFLLFVRYSGIEVTKIANYLLLLTFAFTGLFMGIFNIIYKKQINDWVYFKFGMIGLYTSIIIFIFLVATYFK